MKSYKCYRVDTTKALFLNIALDPIALCLSSHKVPTEMQNTEAVCDDCCVWDFNTVQKSNIVYKRKFQYQLHLCLSATSFRGHHSELSASNPIHNTLLSHNNHSNPPHVLLHFINWFKSISTSACSKLTAPNNKLPTKIDTKNKHVHFTKYREWCLCIYVRHCTAYGWGQG